MQVMQKDGHDDRLARTPAHAVQLRHDGWTVKAEDVVEPPAKQYPHDYTVDEVNAYLETVVGDEVVRVFEEEAAGQARKGILEGPQAVRHPL